MRSFAFLFALLAVALVSGVAFANGHHGRNRGYIPATLPKELTTLLQAGNEVRIERIVFMGHTSPEGFWWGGKRCNPQTLTPLKLVETEGLLQRKKARHLMVAANNNLLKEVRRLAIKDELLAMRRRGRLVVPAVLPKAVGKK
jgi:hypothetical protein